MKVSHTAVIAVLIVQFFLPTLADASTLEQDVTTQQADSIIRNTANIVILDVRTPEEYRLGHLQNAVLMDFYDSKFHYNANTLPKEATILVYCRSGRRSADALEILKNLRYPRVFNMLGGIVAWKKEGRKLVKGS